MIQLENIEPSDLDQLLQQLQSRVLERSPILQEYTEDLAAVDYTLFLVPEGEGIRVHIYAVNQYDELVVMQGEILSFSDITCPDDVWEERALAKLEAEREARLARDIASDLRAEKKNAVFLRDRIAAARQNLRLQKANLLNASGIQEDLVRGAQAQLDGLLSKVANYPNAQDILAGA